MIIIGSNKNNSSDGGSTSGNGLSGNKSISNGIDGNVVTFALETRGEDGTSVTTITPTSPAGGLELDATGVATCLYLATTSTSAGNGSREQVRVVVAGGGDVNEDYWVVRIFPLIFFDSARAY